MFDSPEFLNRSVNIARVFISQKVKEGDTVVDATAGNGNDTLFLAQSVGASGKVYSFDVQSQAIDNTKKLLDENGLSGNVTLIQDGHENLDSYIKEGIKVVVFNLGYLPGSDKSVSTNPKNTITAIGKALPLLVNGGAIFLAIYYGEPTGPEEKDRVLEFTSNLDQQQYNVSYLSLINQANNPPSLLSIEKREKAVKSAEGRV